MEKLDNLLMSLKQRHIFVPWSEFPGPTKAIFLLLWSQKIKYNVVLKLSVCHSICVLDKYIEFMCFFSTIKKTQCFQHLFYYVLW